MSHRRKAKGIVGLSGSQADEMRAKFADFLNKWQGRRARIDEINLPPAEEIWPLIVRKRGGEEVISEISRKMYNRASDQFFLTMTDRRVYESIMDSIFKKVGFKGNEKVLSIASGSGHLESFIAKNLVPNGKVVGLDFSEGMVNTARKVAAEEGAKNASFYKEDARNLRNVLDQHFDVVMALDAINWVGERNVNSTVEQISDKMKKDPGSTFILGFPLRDEHSSKVYITRDTVNLSSDHISHEQVTDFVSMLKKRGLEVEKKVAFRGYSAVTGDPSNRRLLLIIRPKKKNSS